MLIADKYGMPAIMQRAEYLFMDHLNDMSLDRNSKSFAWTWILRAEQCGLSAVARASIGAHKGRDVHWLVQTRPKTELAQLSSGTLAHLVDVMSGQMLSNIECPEFIYC